MAISTLKKHLFTTVAGVALAFGMASTAQASVVPFSVNPGAIGATGDAYYVNQFNNVISMTGDSSELLTATGVSTHSGSGYIHYGFFTQDGGAHHSTSSGGAPGSGLDVYVTFNFTETVGAQFNTVTSLNYLMFADMHANDTYTQATASGPGTAATVTNGSETVTMGADGTPITTITKDVELGYGKLITGTSSFTANGGTTFDASTTFTLTSDGQLFFPSPFPFFNQTYNAFVNTSNGVTYTANSNPLQIAINNAGGVTTLNFPVPEPTSVALLGLGLLALAGSVGRRQQ